MTQATVKIYLKENHILHFGGNSQTLKAINWKVLQ